MSFSKKTYFNKNSIERKHDQPMCPGDSLQRIYWFKIKTYFETK